MEDQLFVGRQPILTTTEEIFGYDLLFRSGAKGAAGLADRENAAAKLVVGALNDIGIAKILGDRAGILNINEEFIRRGIHALLPKEQFILEIMETTKVDAVFVTEIQRLKQEGYMFSLGDFILDDRFLKQFQALFDKLSFVKIDVSRNTGEMALAKMKLFKNQGVKFIADKVESRDAFHAFRQLHFDYYQGYFFSKPVMVQGRKIHPDKIAITRLISLIMKEPDVDQIEKNFRPYPTLTINLLKFMNSAAMFLRSRITSIRQAITMLGTKKLLQWLLLMAYANPDQQNDTNPLFQTSLQRARLMEYLIRLAPKGAARADEAFLAGLLSLLDVLFSRPMQDILGEMNIDDAIKGAILRHEEDIGQLLLVAQRYETESWDDIDAALQKLGLRKEDLLKGAEESIKMSSGFGK